jgi:hypothetical protein
VLSSPSPVLRPHPTPCPASVRLPVVRLYAPPPPDPQMPGPGEGLPSSRVHLLALPSPVPRRVLERLPFQVFGAVRGLRRDLSGSALSCPLRVGLTRLQGSRDAAGWPVASPKGLLTLRFDAERFPPTPAACYGAPWRLPRPDLHRLANTSLCVGYLRRTTSSPHIPAPTSLGTTNGDQTSGSLRDEDHPAASGGETAIERSQKKAKPSRLGALCHVTLRLGCSC